MDSSLGPLSKLEFMQWKDVDCPTFTQICKSAINWLDYGNSLSGIQTDIIHNNDNDFIGMAANRLD